MFVLFSAMLWHVSGVVASYHFNGGDYAYDSSLYANIGVLYGDAPWVTGLRTSSGFSYGLSFDGEDDYVVVDDDSILDFGTGSFTFSAWIKWGGWVSGDYNRIIQKSNYPSQWWCIDIASDGRVQFESNIGTVPMNWAPPLLEEGKWVHLAVVVDRTNNYVYYYKNGNLHFYPYAIGSAGSPDSNNDLVFAPDALFHGVIDEAKVYDRALSSSETYDYYTENEPVCWFYVFSDAYPYGGWIKIDGEYTGNGWTTVSQGSHTVEVTEYLYFPGYGYYNFAYYIYDDTSYYDTLITVDVSETTDVSAHYEWSPNPP
jgi:hypothetical protein